MKFNCNWFRDRTKNRRENRKRRFSQWHDWFAWYPVKIAQNDCRWLEIVQRQGYYGQYGSAGFLYWNYQPISLYEKYGR